MADKTIPAIIAWNLRKRGLGLPTHAEYATPRLKEIALRQAALMKELADLDCELMAAANEDEKREAMAGVRQWQKDHDDKL
jgi:hypothetical protein